MKVHSFFAVAILTAILSVFSSCSVWAVSPPDHSSKETGKSTHNDITAGAPENSVFVVSDAITNTDDFAAYAKLLSRLKSYGRVDVSINSPALDATFDIGGPWHEYASYNLAVSAFYPDEKIAPFFPAEYIKANRQLLEGKLKILRKYGLSASFGSNEPRYLPEAFYTKYPELRGPRVDHPRRSNQMAFAPCFHEQGTLDMYKNMVGELFRNAPEINTVSFSMNDAGSGFCWNDWLYTGPNGPSSCHNKDKNIAIINLLNIYKDEAKEVTGHDIDIYLGGMFTDEELDHLVSALPDRCFLRSRNVPESIRLSSMIWEAYPVKGLINPVRIVNSLGMKDPSQPQHFSMGFSGSYHRGTENLETIEKVVNIVTDFLDHPPSGESAIDNLNSLRTLCVKWGGEDNADRLMKAFIDFDDALSAGRIAAPGLSTLYWGVSNRQITRPLVFATDRLSPEEETYFLPYVFNISDEEARDDYMDIHGASREIPAGSAASFARRLSRVAASIEKINGAPEQEYLNHFAMSVRLLSSIIRSCGNFNDAQMIRNRHREALEGTVHRPNKIPTWSGDQDLLDFNALMRDELDNTQELIDLLGKGGMDLVCHASPPFPEDTFLLGADLIDQLKLKRNVMLRHWTDIEGYLTTPFK